MDVGDGANDRPMLEAAGLAIAYDAKRGMGTVADESVTTMAELLAALRYHGILPTEHMDRRV